MRTWAGTSQSMFLAEPHPGSLRIENRPPE